MGLAWSILRWIVPGRRAVTGTVTGLAWILGCAFCVLILSRELGAGLRLFFLCSCALGIALYFWGLEERVRSVPETRGVYIDDLFKKKKKHRKAP